LRNGEPICTCELPSPAKCGVSTGCCPSDAWWPLP
jgi:hypothetical protein